MPIQLSQAQLQALAALTPDTHDHRIADALRPIGRVGLYSAWVQARQQVMAAHGRIQDAELGPGWRMRELGAPRPPPDLAALRAARQCLAEAEACHAAAWARIQRLVDRAAELLRADAG